jgi:pimeloyl-ACP methyl ester carboxylesterase
VNGDRSRYFEDGDQELIKKIFPKAKFATLNTGHWVQAEKPQEFAQTVLQFLNGK